MSSSPLAKKLKVKENSRMVIINAPLGYLDEVEPLPDGVELVTEPQGQVDFAHLFVKDSTELEQSMPVLLKTLGSNSMLWVSFPKRSSQVQTDLSRDLGWEPLQKAGFQAVSLVSIDDTWSAMRFRAGQDSSDQALAAAQYVKKKAALMPIYDYLIKAAQDFGSDVELVPRKTYVGLVRGKMFAVIKASTATRLDLGLKLKNPIGDVRLVEAPGFGSGSITHKIALVSIEQVDEQVLGWLEQAYNDVGT